MADETPPPAHDFARLIGAVQEWTQQNLPAAPDGAATCEWCPLCQFVAVLRGERPEVTERVTEAGAALSSAFHALVEAATSGLSGTERSAGPTVERIDLDEAGADDES